MSESNKTVTIYHLDDEPSMVDWIPDSIYNYYRLQHPSWVKDTRQPGEEDELPMENEEGVFFTFCLHTTWGIVDVIYKIFRAPDLYIKHLPPQPQPQDIIILDVITEMPDGSLDAKGIELYRDACQKMQSSDRVYIFSGFPKRITAETHSEIPPGHLLIKPADASEVVQTIVQQISSVFGA